jgi:peptide/nickel transport system permease protein
VFWYFIRRVLISIPVLLVGTFVAFVVVASSGDPLESIRTKPGVTQAQIDSAAHTLGLDHSILVRYWNWLTDILFHGNWGISQSVGSTAGQSVYDSVSRALLVTTRLVVGAELVALVIGVSVGVLAAVKQYSIFDYGATTVAFLMFSMPVFCLAVILKSYGIQLNDVLQSMGMSERWLTTAGPGPDTFSGTIGHQIFAYTGAFLLPTITLAAISFASYSRFQRASMLETLNADYVRTARAKGLSNFKVIFRHAFRNALIPVTTQFALQFGATFSGAILTETVFGWSGMGVLLVNSVQHYDAPMLMGWLLVTSVIIMFFNLLADLVYGVLDPRIRVA